MFTDGEIDALPYDIGFGIPHERLELTMSSKYLERQIRSLLRKRAEEQLVDKVYALRKKFLLDKHREAVGNLLHFDIIHERASSIRSQIDQEHCQCTCARVKSVRTKLLRLGTSPCSSVLNDGSYVYKCH